MEWDTLFTPVITGVQGVISDVLPIAIPVLVTLAGLTIGLKLLGKVGVRR